ncbi:tetratricopeptide repeat protein [Pseudomonas sp. Pse1]|jgi:tetratricopeptide (TPR) repeat protein|uniref:NfrA family protein n=1 Tax=Pseudomonas sp. Pse1 TaxID=2926020 RepID=UPI002118E0A5|nr:tetratricopeptide repeat protein [Pseudomonas sp. Pse1]
MIPTSRLLVLTAALFCGASFLSLPASAAAYEAPLEGEAWQQADLAYKSYQAGRYRDALEQVNAALKLRPDVVRLNLLQVYTLQKLGRTTQARQAAQAAIKRGVDDPALRATVKNLQPQGAAAPGKGPSAAYQKGFPLATKGYAAYNAGDMPGAASYGEQAFRADPTQGPWALLWLDALEAQEKWSEGVAAANQAIALKPPNLSDLEARRAMLQRRMAVLPTQQAYKALIEHNPAEAARLARVAVDLAPDVASQRLLLVTALLQNKQPAAAEQAATEALQENDENTVMLVMRAYLRQLQGNADAAKGDFDEALAQDWLDDDQRRNVRLIAIDGALASGDTARADQLLSQLDASDEATIKRRKALDEAKKPPAKLTTALYPAPAQSCQDTPYGTQCELLPSDQVTGPGGPATAAYAAYGRQDYQEAITQARLAVEQAPDNPDYQRLLTTALASGNPAQVAEADQRLSRALAVTPNDADLLIQRGYVRQRNRQPDLALQDYRAAEATGKAPPSVILNQAYAQSAMGDNPGAVKQLKKAIDLADANKLEMDDEQRYNTRSAISGLDREWGATVSLGYRGAQPTTNSSGAGLSTAGDSLFSTAELYWRPTQFNDQNGILEVYGRLTNTLYDEGSQFESNQFVDPCSGNTINNIDSNDRSNGTSSTTGFPSTIGSLGVRYMLSDTGFTFGLERRFFLGSATREGTVYPSKRGDQCAIQNAVLDANRTNNPAINGMLTRYQLDSDAGGWLSYITYGFYKGTELRMNESNWFTMDGYAQLGYSWEDNDATFTAYDVDTNGSRTRQLAKTDGQLKRQQVFASSELRVGRSLKFDALGPNVVIFPHVVTAADWIWQKDKATGLDFGNNPLIDLSNVSQDWSLTNDATSWSLGVGPGIAARYWFREDHYHAPRSSVSWSMQYRYPIGGGATERAKGLFMNLIFSY